MRYAPGSFSKNFAWHGTGLRKLHASVRSGFSAQARPVRRERWRADSQISDPSLELIPINFFLHNKNGQMSVDELVLMALRKPHSLSFDRLALFALHLNRVGTGPRIVERPAMWANEFVRERLWDEDAWRASALTEANMDAFITERMKASEEVRIKCRSNYRHMFSLCGYLPAPLPLINARPEPWLGSALFLAWDRHLLDGGVATKTELLALVNREEHHKLLGTSETYLASQAETLADLYLDGGNLGRAALPDSNPAPNSIAVSTPTESAGSIAAGQSDLHAAGTEVPEEETIEWIDQDESDAVVERRHVELQAQVRNRKKAAALKSHYDSACLFCGVRLQVDQDRHYAEAAHVKALGKPHNGPDRASNMIILCPNHHLQFDRGVLRLEKTPGGYTIRSRVNGDSLHGKQVVLSHDLDPEYVKYHWIWHSARRR
jgi:hypothetical protein